MLSIPFGLKNVHLQWDQLRLLEYTPVKLCSLYTHSGEYRTIAPNIKKPTDFMQQFPNLISEFKVHGIKRPDHLNELPQTLKAVHSVVVADSTASSFVTSSSTTYSRTSYLILISIVFGDASLGKSLIVGN